MNQKPQNLLQLIPAKWAIAIVAVLIAYAVTQPWLNRQFGWKLPSVASMTGQESPAQQDRIQKEIVPKDASNQNGISESELDLSKGTTTRDVEPVSVAKNKTNEQDVDKEDPLEKLTTPKKPVEQTSEVKKSQPPKTIAPEPKQETKPVVVDEGKKYGLLTEIGKNRFQSPAGLVYGPGSEEGHRLKHVERHLEDQPDRPGKHGVFDGDMQSALRKIDDAYQRSQRNEKGTTSRKEDGRTVIEASFDKPIGYIGGRDGKRSSNPPAKRLRLVVDERKNVITAFPF